MRSKTRRTFSPEFRLESAQLVVFDMLILKLLCFGLKIAEVSLSKWAYLVSR